MSQQNVTKLFLNFYQLAIERDSGGRDQWIWLCVRWLALAVWMQSPTGWAPKKQNTRMADTWV
jgi:hypothetical protein